MENDSIQKDLFENFGLLVANFIPANMTEATMPTVEVGEEKIIMGIPCPIDHVIIKVELPLAVNQAIQSDEAMPSGIMAVYVNGAGIAECGHSFIIYLDKNYKVRGYQKIDYEAMTIVEEKPKAKSSKSKKK